MLNNQARLRGHKSRNISALKKEVRCDPLGFSSSKADKVISTYSLRTATLTMTDIHAANEPTASHSILAVGAIKFLTGKPISSAMRKDWQKAGEIASHFDNQGFDLDPEDTVATLERLRAELRSRAWDGILLGLCIRKHLELTELFEQVVSVCVDETRLMEGVSLMFDTGPGDPYETVLRNFPQ